MIVGSVHNLDVWSWEIGTSEGLTETVVWRQFPQVQELHDQLINVNVRSKNVTFWNQFSSEYFSSGIANFHCAQLNLRPSKFAAHTTDVLCPSDCDFPLQPAWWTGFRSAVASSRFIPYNGVQTPTVCCSLTVRHETMSLSRLGLKAQDYGKFLMRYASRSVCILVRRVRICL